MSLKQHLTNVAVDSVMDYLKERLEKVKQLDLDGDGHKDVDQLTELLMHAGAKVKISLESTDFPKLASGLDQMMTGASLIGASVDREKLSDALSELAGSVKQLGRLLQTGINELKEREESLG